MYDFYYGTKEEILNNEEEYLLFLKRLLPRWVNGIPDSEYIALFNVLKNLNSNETPPNLVETGSGASSLVMFYYAATRGGHLYSWDTNGSKSSFLRNIVNDTICKSFELPLHKFWSNINFMSTNPYMGLGVLKELNVKVDFCMLDSYHTLNNVIGELELLSPSFNSTAYVALDDANYTNKYENFSYINMFRKKLGLSTVQEPEDNKCEQYHIEAEKFLQNDFHISRVSDTYKDNYKDDIFFPYYSADKKVMNTVGMEKLDNLEHRFDAFEIKRK
jgi:cephalosporin hydroxylase